VGGGGGKQKNFVGEDSLVIMTSAGSYGKGNSILSRFQLKHYGCKAYDRPRALGGRQLIQAPDGHVFK